MSASNPLLLIPVENQVRELDPKLLLACVAALPIYRGSVAVYSLTADPVVLSALTAMGIGTLMAVAGGVLFVFYSTMSLFKMEVRKGA